MVSGSTSSEGGVKVKRTNRSGSRPESDTRRTLRPPRLSMITSKVPDTLSRTRTTVGSSCTSSGATAEVACTKVAVASMSALPSEVASTVTVRVASLPASGGGAASRTRAITLSPANTSTDGGEKVNVTTPSGSRPDRNTRLVRVPRLLSSTASSVPLSLSRTRSSVGSSRRANGVSAAAT